MKKRIKAFMTAAVLLIAAGILYYFINKIFGLSIFCPIYKITGLYCPGCGITRMFLDIAELDFKCAFGHNMAVFISLPVIIYVLIKQSIRYIKSGTLMLNKFDEALVYVLIGILVIFAVLRNIPIFNFLTP